MDVLSTCARHSNDVTVQVALVSQSFLADFPELVVVSGRNARLTSPKTGQSPGYLNSYQMTEDDFVFDVDPDNDRKGDRQR